MYGIIRTRKILKTLKNHWEKINIINTCQCTHVQNHAYTNKSRGTYVCNVCKLSNTESMLKDVKNSQFILKI